MTEQEFIKKHFKRFNMTELLYDFDSGSLAIKLRRAGLGHIADKIEKIPHNAKALCEIYRIFGLNPEYTEEEIRQQFNLQKQL